MIPLAALLLAAVVPLSPAQPEPTPPGGGYTDLLPTYIVSGDGTRMQCTPTYNYCWPDTSGRPTYREG